MANRYDVIIFGVSGFTGLRTIPFLTKMIDNENLSVTWAVAGRSESKIKRLLKELGEKENVIYDKVPIIIADINDQKSLVNMTSQARLIVNATGPYRLYGEPVIKACLETSTHCIDVTAEAQFIDGMHLKYNEEAQKKGAIIISACGMASIPGDLGIAFLKKNFTGTLNSVESYNTIQHDNPSLPGPLVHTGTYESIMYYIGNQIELFKIRRQLFKNKLPKLEPKLMTRILHKSDVVDNMWCVTLPEPDQGVINRSQRYFYEKYNERPIQARNYAAFSCVFYLLLALMYGFVFLIFCQFRCTRKLLLKYPKFFTYGVCGHEGPSDEMQNAMGYALILRGKGWAEKLKDPIQVLKTPPTKEIVAKVSGRNPAYGVTCIAFAGAAITILAEENKMPKGGTLPPAAAFEHTSIIDRLHRNGLTFEIIKE